MKTLRLTSRKLRLPPMTTRGNSTKPPPSNNNAAVDRLTAEVESLRASVALRTQQLAKYRPNTARILFVGGIGGATILSGNHCNED